MQFKALAVAAIATGALAQSPSLDPEESQSVISVLRTALPTSLIYEALTNPAAVSSEIASQFAAGQTPSWYSALPSDIKTILQPNVSAIATGTGFTSSVTSYPNATAITTGNGTVLPTGTLGNGTAGSNSSITSSRSLSRSSTLTVTSSGGSSSSSSGSGSGSGSGSSGSGSSSGTSSTGNGASLPTAVVGMGLAGAAGLIGALVL